jgi:site-specific recombinase XerD
MYEYFGSAKPNADMQQRIELVVTDFTKHYDGSRPSKLVTDDIKGFERIMERFEPSTRFKKMQLLKRVFEFGYAKKYLQENPFAFYRLPRVPKSKKIRLDAAERAAIENYSFQSDRLNQVRDMFLFQYNTGFSYADLSCFNQQYVVRSGGLLYLSGTRAKPPHEAFYLPFNKTAQRIADKYNYRLPVISNQKYNTYLKEIADIVSIHKNLTTHVARRTFSQIMIDAGYSGESVALMMGHEDFKTTQQYYGTISEARVEREREKLAA